MVEPDTIKLLRECDAGIKMGVHSISDVLGHVKNSNLRQLLYTCKEEHNKLGRELEHLLNQYSDSGKEPAFLAEKMAKLKTVVKLQAEETDHAIADLMTDGCNMGVKSLNKYLNQYVAADEVSQNIAKKLVKLESQLALDLRPFL